MNVEIGTVAAQFLFWVSHWDRFKCFPKIAEINLLRVSFSPAIIVLFTGVNDTGNKFIAGVNDTGDD
jgi:hypothetical protein